MKQPSVLLIYTGGTIGMWADPKSGALQPMDLAHLEEQVPELERVKVDLEAVAFEEPIDSSDMNPEHQVLYDTLYGLELVSWVDVEPSGAFGDTVVLGS